MQTHRGMERKTQTKQTKKKNNKTRVREQALEKKKVINKKNFQTKRDDTIVVPLVRRVKRQSKRALKVWWVKTQLKHNNSKTTKDTSRPSKKSGRFFHSL